MNRRLELFMKLLIAGILFATAGAFFHRAKLLDVAAAEYDPRAYPRGTAIVTVRALEHAGGITHVQAEAAVRELLGNPEVPKELTKKK